MKDRLLNAHEVADLLGLRNYRSVYPRMRKAGLIEWRDPAVRGVRWWESEVTSYMRRNNIIPGTPATPTPSPEASPSRWEAAS